MNVSTRPASSRSRRVIRLRGCRASSRARRRGRPASSSAGRQPAAQGPDDELEASNTGAALGSGAMALVLLVIPRSGRAVERRRFHLRRGPHLPSPGGQPLRAEAHLRRGGTLRGRSPLSSASADGTRDIVGLYLNPPDRAVVVERRREVANPGSQSHPAAASDATGNARAPLARLSEARHDVALRCALDTNTGTVSDSCSTERWSFASFSSPLKRRSPATGRFTSCSTTTARIRRRPSPTGSSGTLTVERAHCDRID